MHENANTFFWSTKHETWYVMQSHSPSGLEYTRLLIPIWRAATSFQSLQVSLINRKMKHGEFDL